MAIISVALPLRRSRAGCSPVHPAAPLTAHHRRLARPALASPRSASRAVPALPRCPGRVSRRPPVGVCPGVNRADTPDTMPGWKCGLLLMARILIARTDTDRSGPSARCNTNDTKSPAHEIEHSKWCVLLGFQQQNFEGFIRTAHPGGA